MIQWWEHSQKGVTDRQTDNTICRAAWSQLKITNHNQHAFNIKYLANLIKKYWTCFRCQKLADSPACFPPSVRCRSGGRHLGKCAWGSNLALVFEAVQSTPSTTFPESWHDYSKQYFGSFGGWICLPNSPNWRYRQNYDINKWQVWIREAFLGQISASPGPQMDGIVGKTYQTYNNLPPCQEIDISCHKLSQNNNLVSKYPSLVAAILKLRFSGPRDSDFPADPDFGHGLTIQLGPDLLTYFSMSLETS